VVDDAEVNVTARTVKMLAKITSSENGQFHGELDSEFFKEPFVFAGFMNMVELMETTFDSKGIPEKQLLPRSFGKARLRMRKNEVDLNKFLAEKQGIQGKQRKRRNEAASQQDTGEPTPYCPTFEILVRFRHNAEWQGEIRWVEKSMVNYFSSIVEMAKLMDEALSGKAVTVEDSQ